MIAWFARNGVAANIVMLAVMIAGAWTLWQDKIPLEVFQDVPSRFISVNVPYPASSPEEVEETIVLKIEEAIQQVGGIKHINSTAGSGGGSVFIEVQEGLDPRTVHGRREDPRRCHLRIFPPSRRSPSFRWMTPFTPSSRSSSAPTWPSGI
jgi:multidrug efflux pump subunit AcrB